MYGALHLKTGRMLLFGFRQQVLVVNKGIFGLLEDSLAYSFCQGGHAVKSLQLYLRNFLAVEILRLITEWVNSSPPNPKEKKFLGLTLNIDSLKFPPNGY